MDDDLFAIKIKVGTGAYSLGKITMMKSKSGRAWTSRAHLKNHLRLVSRNGEPGGRYKERYGDNCEVIEANSKGFSTYALAAWVGCHMGE